MKIANAVMTVNVMEPLVIAKTEKTAKKKMKTDNLLSADEQQIPSHMENISRLNRISGQIEGIKKMIEDHRYCPDILIQLHAVRSAVRAVEGHILKKHLQHCVAKAFSSEEEKEQKINELKMLFDKFDKV